MNISCVGNTPTQQQISRFIQQRLNAPDTNGQMNQIQQIDHLDISPQAKTMLETQAAQQMISLHKGSHGHSMSSAQKKSVFNGAVEQAIQAYQNGSGSLDQLESAMTARGQRIGEVAANTGSSSSTSSTSSTSQNLATSLLSPNTPTQNTPSVNFMA